MCMRRKGTTGKLVDVLVLTSNYIQENNSHYRCLTYVIIAPQQGTFRTKFQDLYYTNVTFSVFPVFPYISINICLCVLFLSAVFVKRSSLTFK